MCLYLPCGKIHRKQTKSKFTPRNTHISGHFSIYMFCHNNDELHDSPLCQLKRKLKLIFDDMFRVEWKFFGGSCSLALFSCSSFQSFTIFFALTFASLTIGAVFKARKTNVHGVRALNYGFVNNPDMMQRVFFLLLIETLS